MIECVYKSTRGEVHYWKSDCAGTERKTLVMLHGLTLDHRLFDRQIPYFEKKNQLIVWDAPAHGKSRPYVDFNFPNAAEDLEGILDENGIDNAVMIGQSMGGYVIQSLLSRFPKRASATIFIDCCPYGDYYSKSEKWWLRQVKPLAKVCRILSLNTLKMGMGKICAGTEYAYNNVLTMLTTYSKKELCHLMGLGFPCFFDASRPMEINCPTLLLAGEHDKMGKLLEHNRAWSKRTGFPLHIIPNAAHNSNDDNPEAVNREIEQFLNGVE